MEAKELLIVFLALFMIHLASSASPSPSSSSSSSPLKRPLLLDDDHELQKKMDKDEAYNHRNGTASRSDLGVTVLRGGGGRGGGGGGGGRGGGRGRGNGDGSRGGALIPVYTAGSAGSHRNHKGWGNSKHLDLILIPIPFGTMIASIFFY